jgi:hypothetical protein
MIRSMLLAAMLLCGGDAFAEAQGVDSREAFPPLGCGDAVTGEGAGCHVQNANPELLVSIDGPPAIDLGPEAAGFYTASIPANSFGLMGAGINVAIDAPNEPGCDLEAFGPTGKIGPLNEFGLPDPVLSHLHAGDPPPIPTLVGVWAYEFLVLNCQTPGTLLLRVAMNAFDGNGDETGEVWNASTLEIAVPEAGAAASALAALGALGAATALRRRR